MRSLEQPQDSLGNCWPMMMPPVVSSPSNGAVGLSVLVGLPLALATGLTVLNGSDAQESTDWEVRTQPLGGGSLVWSAHVTNPLQLLTATVPALTLAVGQTYYIRARTNGATMGAGLWSADVMVTT